MITGLHGRGLTGQEKIKSGDKFGDEFGTYVIWGLHWVDKVEGVNLYAIAYFIEDLSGVSSTWGSYKTEGEIRRDKRVW